MNDRYSHLLMPGDCVQSHMGRGTVVRRQPNRRVVVRIDATGQLKSFNEISLSYLPYIDEIERKKEQLLRSRRDLRLRYSLGLDRYHDHRWQEEEACFA